MIVSALLRTFSPSASNLERVKDDDSEPGLGSWLVGDQPPPPASTGVPGFGGGMTEATSGLIDNLANLVADSPISIVSNLFDGDWFVDWLQTWVLGTTGLLGAWWLFRWSRRLLGGQRGAAEWKKIPITPDVDQVALVKAMQSAGIRCAPGEAGYVWVNAYHLGIAQRFIARDRWV